ncbi:hypothetical protein SARC_07113 [Sphaeroforma arctica JP610]|uniref:Presequence translocated-associated motor subunit PAM17, mitochondrial n=1 Tax=Sphaeroforma arctica JP610 TaxID=667725 RepID=A0A0L0FVF5_9EUKA|nr:hypothetical protein SARC_07113 [Sphaeroforma arctica JP610]KNC80541.1 hypothetical protein SARC_07113 [Sphaeroforma arctica JP610]|eukprot:XP_014154443.1 hypothetical protein SARC_07113 [Sphaeroforma arctica JP610]
MLRTILSRGVPAYSLRVPVATSAIRHAQTTTRGEQSDREMTMPFEEYRQLKKSLKTRGRIFGVPTGFGSMFGTSFAILSANPNIMEPPANVADIQLIMGMDPMVATVLATSVMGGVGYVMGGAMYGLVWRLINGHKARQISLRDEDFLNRLDKYRFSDDQKQEDDYYGDKIITVADYRAWLKDQNKKANKNMLDFQWHKKPAFM